MQCFFDIAFQTSQLLSCRVRDQNTMGEESELSYMLRYPRIQCGVSGSIDSEIDAQGAEMPGLVLVKMRRQSYPFWYHGTMFRIPLDCLSLPLKETSTPFSHIKQVHGGMVHQMSKEEDSPQEQK